MGFVNLTIRIYWKDVLPWPWNSEELIPQTNRKNVHITYSWSVLCPPSEVVMQFINKVWESVWEKTECSWTMVLESGVKQRVGWLKKRTGRSYCDFLMFVHQRTRGILDTNMVRYFDRIYKSVGWPCTYDNTDLLMAGSSSLAKDVRFSF